MIDLTKSIFSLLLWGFALYGAYHFYLNGHHKTVYFFLHDLYHAADAHHERVLKSGRLHELENTVAKQPYFKKEYGYIISVNRSIDRYDALLIIQAVNQHYKKTGFRKLDIYAIMAHESGFRKDAVGHIDPDDRGICQVNKQTYRWLVSKYDMPYKWERMFEIHYNVEMATLLLKDYRKKVREEFYINAHPEKDLKDFEDVILIGSYNKGIQGTKRHLDAQKPIRYIDHVNKFRNRFSSE